MGKVNAMKMLYITTNMRKNIFDSYLYKGMRYHVILDRGKVTYSLYHPIHHKVRKDVEELFSKLFDFDIFDISEGFLAQL